MASIRVIIHYTSRFRFTGNVIMTKQCNCHLMRHPLKRETLLLEIVLRRRFAESLFEISGKCLVEA